MTDSALTLKQAELDLLNAQLTATTTQKNAQIEQISKQAAVRVAQLNIQITQKQAEIDALTSPGN